MLFREQVNVISIINHILKILCLAISLILIGQLLHIFVEERPTTTTNLEEELEISDLPEVVACMDPGFNNSTLTKYGYNINYYWKGISVRNREKFVGWNGDKHYNKSSHEILEEVLLFPKKSHGLLRYAKYFQGVDDSKDAKVTFRMLISPLGRCMVISPPSQENSGHFKPDTLRMVFSNAIVDHLKFSSAKLRVFFMDNVNSPKYNPDNMEMVGDQIEIGPGKNTFSFRTRISRSEHVKGDPLFDCTIYTEDNSFEDCIKKFSKETFEKEIGCQPPPFADDIHNICNQKFNFSPYETCVIEKRMDHIVSTNLRSNCQVPCTKTTYTTRLKSKTPFYSGIRIIIMFDQKVDVARSRFSINSLTLLTRLGGLIGVGRTLLWILVSLLGAAQVTL